MLGWFFRKSIKIGPTRINFSKSGIGASIGVKGARVSFGPRGTYITVGTGGGYYQKKLSNSSNEKKRETPQIHNTHVNERQENNLEKIETAEVEQLISSSSSELLNEINEKHRKVRFVTLGIIGIVLLFLFLAANLEIAFAFLAALFTCLILIPLGRIDKKRKSVELVYNLDDMASTTFHHLNNALLKLNSTHKLWRINSRGGTNDWKRNAGASNLITRNAIRANKTSPIFLITNVEVYNVNCGDQTIYFFPDRLLIYQSKKVAEIKYRELQVKAESQRFIEDELVPRDSNQVDTTWKYVNKNGTPDRRFNNNRQLPIMLYGKMTLSSASGLNILMYVSNPNIPEMIQEAVNKASSFFTEIS